jgi:hypothetical protein
MLPLAVITEAQGFSVYELENEVEHNVQMDWTTLEISYCWSCLYVLVGSNKQHNLHYVRR